MITWNDQSFQQTVFYNWLATADAAARRLCFFGHVARMDDSQDTFRALHTSIRGLPKDQRRRPNRPHHTCLQTLEADFQTLNHRLGSASRHAQDRGR